MEVETEELSKENWRVWGPNERDEKIPDSKVTIFGRGKGRTIKQAAWNLSIINQLIVRDVSEK